MMIFHSEVGGYDYKSELRYLHLILVTGQNSGLYRRRVFLFNNKYECIRLLTTITMLLLITFENNKKK